MAASVGTIRLRPPQSEQGELAVGAFLVVQQDRGQRTGGGRGRGEGAGTGTGRTPAADSWSWSG